MKGRATAGIKPKENRVFSFSGGPVFNGTILLIISAIAEATDAACMDETEERPEETTSLFAARSSCDPLPAFPAPGRS